MGPIRLTDAQLDAIMRACGPLRPDARGAFLEAVAAALQGREIGDGGVGRAIAAAQKQFFDAPLSTDGRQEPPWGQGAVGRAPVRSFGSRATPGDRVGRWNAPTAFLALPLTVTRGPNRLCHPSEVLVSSA
jgi:hypothetical protein